MSKTEVETAERPKGEEEGVNVVGVGLTSFGEYPDRTTRDLFGEAAQKAFESSSIKRDDVDMVYYGNFIAELSELQGHQGPQMAQAAGVRAPATRVESACASSGAAVREAVKEVRNGESDVVLVGGAERMNNMGTAGATEGLAAAADALYEIKAGVTFPGAYALMARAYFNEFGGSREDLGNIAIKNHKNGAKNELAHFQREIDMVDVLEAPMVSDPLYLYDCCPISDGASALLVASDTYAKEHGLDGSVSIIGTGQAGDSLALQNRKHLAKTPATTEAAREAFDDADVSIDDVDAVEVHDCFTIAEVMALEGLGFYEHGEAIKAATNRETTKDGSLPVNLSGGLKAKGHPVGATGAAQIAEMVKILKGEHPNAPENAEVGLTHNAGGTVASTTVHILQK